MLPLVVYSTDDEKTEAMSGMLQRCISGHALPLRLECRLSSLGQLLELTSLGMQTMAFFICCEHPSLAGEALLAVRRRDRLSYAVVIADSAQGLQNILRPGMRLSALLLEPVKFSRLLALLQEMIEDDQAQPNAEWGDFEVKVRGRQYILPMESILFFEARDKRIVLRTSAQQVVFSDTLQALAERLPAVFLRVHNAFIVNLSHIVTVDYKAMELIFFDGLRIPFSRTYKPALREALDRRSVGGAQ